MTLNNFSIVFIHSCMRILHEDLDFDHPRMDVQVREVTGSSSSGILQ